MSYDINRSRSSTRSAGCNEDCNVFIKNIPIELEKEGLQNLFVKAGAVEKIKIIPPKDENHSYTFGFVEFKHKTAAATAIEMFDNYKIGGKYLTVKLASNNNNTNSSSRYESSQKKPLSDYNSDGYSRSNSRARSETAPVLQSPQNEIDDGWSDIKVMKPTRVNLVDNENDDPFQRGTRVDANKRMMGGRGILLKQQYKKEPPRNQIRDNFDLSRPFARDLCLRKSQASLTDIEPLPETVPSKESSKESSKEYNKGQHVVLDSKRKAEEFVIGKRYHVILTHGTTPSNFFVQQLSILPDSFDPSNTDYYKKELLENKNNEYSCRPQRSSIRCKLNNLIPAFNAKKWSSDACEIFESLIGDNTIDEVLIANVISCEDFEPQKGRIEKIYGIDLFFGNESTIEYMIRENIAVQNLEGRNNAQINLYYKPTNEYDEPPTAYQFEAPCNGFDNDFQVNLEAQIEKDCQLVRSVSMEFTTRDLTKLLCPFGRNKMFNGSFKIFKKRELVASVEKFKCGHVFEGMISFVEESQEFYLQKTSRMDDLCSLETCIQNYANVLLNEASLREELYAFQANSAKLDVVLVKAKWDDKWHRAIYLEKLSSSDLRFGDDEYDDFKSLPQASSNKKEKNYYSFKLIDYGRSILVQTIRNDPNLELFILPMNERLMIIGSFALRCSLNEYKLRERYSESREKQHKASQLFEKKFKRMMENQVVKVQVCQLTTVKAELDALVILYFLPEDAQRLALSDDIDFGDEKICENIPFINLKSSSGEFKLNLKLNCIYYIMRSIHLAEIESDKEIKENNEESDDKFVQLSQASSEQPLVQQKPKIVESIVTPIIEKQITHLEIKKINHVKLEKNRQYKFLLMFFDENFIEQSFSLSLQEQASKEQELSNKLQEAYSNDFISKPTSLADLKVDMRLEALYDVDERWYRVRVTEIKNNSVKIHFLDYGNTVILSSAEVSSKLRFREYYKNVEEERIFGLEYQAIKCVYSTDNKKDVSDFFEKLSVIEETDSLLNGFELSVKEIIAEDMDNLVYRVVFPSEDVDQDTTSNVPAVKTEPSEAMHQTEATLDNEVSNILEDATALNQYSIFNMPETAGKSIDLDANKEYNVSISHIVGINEFYVQLPDNLRELMEHQERINNLAEAIRSPQTSPNNVGDYIIARYVYDSAWYKGIITKVNKTTDDYLYEVFFVDYGNTEVDMTGHDILSVQYIIESLTQQDKKKLIIEMANVIEFSFQAICCQLKDKKDSIRNTESLKTYMSDCLTFTIKSQCKSASQFIGDIVKINKDTVSLYTDGKLLDENFEPVAVETLVNEVQSQETKIPEKVEDKVKDKVEVKRQEDAQDEEKFEEKVNILEVGSVHKYKLAFFASETEIYFNLAAEYDCLAQMQDEINKSKNSISGFQNMNEVKIGDVVLAKFYEEDHSSFSWYRVRIVDLSDKDMVTVFYLGLR